MRQFRGISSFLDKFLTFLETVKRKQIHLEALHIDVDLVVTLHESPAVTKVLRVGFGAPCRRPGDQSA